MPELKRMDSKPTTDRSSNVKSLFLSVLSLLSILFIVLTLQSSWNNPQEQTKLDLLQTDLILQANQPIPTQLLPNQDGTSSPSINILETLLSNDGQDLYKQALASYQEVLETNRTSLNRLELALGSSNNDSNLAIANQLKRKRDSFGEVSLRMGLLQVQTGDVKGAIATWQGVQDIEREGMTNIGMMAQILTGLWSEPTLLYPDAEGQIRRNLDGWYRQAALTQLYIAQQRPEEITELGKQASIEVTAAINRLAIVNSIPLIGGGFGIILWAFLLGQWIFFRKSSPFHSGKEAIASTDSEANIPQQGNWQVPWGLETIWEVMVLWFSAFCLVTQFVLPLIFESLGIQSRIGDDYNLQALTVLVPYVVSVSPMLPILQTSLSAYRPLPQGWFRINVLDWRWLVWGIGGYFAAVPLVLIVSIISQRFLQGQGGGNPLLPILVDSQNNLPKFLLWTTLAIAAPFFEEYLFRGFLLPSLTKFVPVWAAIAMSGFLFALAHLNIADIIPLTVLGMVLGFVYWRSKNLLTSMLLHSLWNSGSFFALIALGGK